MATKEFEIELIYVGKGKEPDFMRDDLGFPGNPPIVVRAKNRASARRRIKLPKTVKIKSIKRSG